MFLSAHALPRPQWMFASALVTLALASTPAFGQSPRGPRIPGEAHGYQIMQIQQAYNYRRAEMPRPAVVATPTRMTQPRTESGEVVVRIPQQSTATETVSIRGVDGNVRTFPIVGGRQAVVIRHFTLHPGESLTLNFGGAAPTRAH